MFGWFQRRRTASRPALNAAIRDLTNACDQYLARVAEIQRACPHEKVIATKFAGMPRWGRLCLECGLEELANSPHASHPTVYWPGDDTRRKRRLTAEFVKQVDFREYNAARIPTCRRLPSIPVEPEQTSPTPHRTADGTTGSAKQAEVDAIRAAG